MVGRRQHWTVKARLDNLATVREWCQGTKNYTPKFRKQLQRKCMLVLGCTRAKAREYISLVVGDEE